jgi:hypothetical protein
VNGATNLTIDSTSGPVASGAASGASVLVSPTVTTAYTLTASNPAGKNTATVTLNVVDQLKINSFTANPALIGAGQSSTLSWALQGAVQVIIEPDVGDVTGSTSVVVNPAATTEYDLTAIDGTGTRFFAKTTVTVVSVPVISSFTANPAKISNDQSSVLQWSIVGPTTNLTIDNGVGDVTGKTSVTVSPTATTTYTLTATNAQGGFTEKSTKQTTVTFSSSFVPILTSFTASAASVDPGHGVALTAVFDAGPGGTATIDHGVGAVSSGVPISTGGLTSSTTFTLTLTNGSNSVTGHERIIDGDIVDFAGVPSKGGSNDGPGASATFNTAMGIAVDSSGNLFVADGSPSNAAANNTIRKITPDGVVSTLAGTAGQTGSNDGAGAEAQFNNPQSVAVDASGNLYVADFGNNTIRKITPDGVVSTFAGTAGQAGSLDGTGAAARFNGPEGVAVGPSGNIYVADTVNETIRKITPDGVVSTFAGTAGQAGSDDGNGVAAKFHFPNGVAVDANENVYVADRLNQRIRAITSAGLVTTLAGSGAPGDADGTGTGATFNNPMNVAVGVDPSSGQTCVYVADFANERIRRVTTAGVVETIVGSGPVRFIVDPAGPLPGAIDQPFGVAVDPTQGRLYISLPSDQLIITTPF